MNRHVCSLLWNTLLTVVTLVAIPASAEPPSADQTADSSQLPLNLKHPDLRGCVVLGASVSAGAEVSLPGFPPAVLEGHANFADVLAAMIGEQSAKDSGLVSLASWRFFMDPTTMAELQIGKAKERAGARVVFAIDYLFWHAYGGGLSDDARRRTFEQGLERLASLPSTSTIVVADLPDMTHAVGLMLTKDMVPSLELQAELNQRLERWAAEKEHSNVLLLPLRRVVENAWNSRELELGGRTYKGERARGLLTNSGLHATLVS